MTNRGNGPCLPLLAALAATVFGCGPEAAIDRSEGRPGLRGLELEEPYQAPGFTLVDTEGRPFDFRSETRGSLTLLFFGYTHCPDICPVQMSILDAALSRLSYRERASIEVVFVTTDPARDTPERLRGWLDLYDTSFVGLLGDLEAVNRVQAAFGLPEAVIDMPPTDGGAEQYYVGHATPVLAITGEGLVRAFYPSGARQADWQHDLPVLLALNESVASPAEGPPGAGG